MPNRAGPPPVQNQERAVARWENNLTEVRKGLAVRADQFDALLGREHRDRWITVALHALAQNRNVLSDCTPESVIEAIRESAALNLSPTGLLGEGWILPYRDQAKFQPGYRGYLKLLRNSGQVKIVDCQIVYMNDEFGIQLGTDPKIHHVPILYGERNEEGEYIAERGEYRGVYSWVRLVSGETKIEYMSWDDVMKIRALSPSVRANRASPWDDHAGEMARKTVLRRMMKQLPLESMPILAKAAALDEEADVIEGTAVEVTPASSSRATAAAYALGRGATDEENEPLGTSEKAPEAVADVADVALCGKASPYGDSQTCVLPAGHDRNHKAVDGSSWE